MIYCGNDIIEVNRIKEAIDTVIGFKERVFSKNEIEEIEKSEGQYKYQRYAGRFAAKEAIYKAISKLLIDYECSYSLEDVEILNVDKLKRRPKVRFINDKLNNLLKNKEANIDVSISHIKEFATSVAVISLKEEN